MMQRLLMITMLVVTYVGRLQKLLKRTENLLKGFHPSEITCRDLEKKEVFLTAEGSKLFVKLCAIVRGKTAKTDSEVVLSNKRKIENCVNYEQISHQKP